MRQYAGAPLKVVKKDTDWSAERRYARQMRAFLVEVGGDLGIHIGDPPVDTEDFQEYWNYIEEEVDFFIMRARLRAARKTPPIASSAALAEADRAEIHKSIDLIRKIVLASGLPESRKEVIVQKLHSLSAEIDRTRSRLEVLTQVWLDVTQAVGEGFENLSPALDRLEEIAGIFGKCRSSEEKALPGAERNKLLPPPHNS